MEVFSPRARGSPRRLCTISNLLANLALFARGSLWIGQPGQPNYEGHEFHEWGTVGPGGDRADRLWSAAGRRAAPPRRFGSGSNSRLSTDCTDGHRFRSGGDNYESLPRGPAWARKARKWGRGAKGGTAGTAGYGFHGFKISFGVRRHDAALGSGTNSQSGAALCLSPHSKVGHPAARL